MQALTPWCRILFAVGFLFVAKVSASAATFAGVPLLPGGVRHIAVPLNAQEQAYSSEGGNVGPARAVAVVAVPPDFNPTKSWPVVVVFSSSDGARRNGDDLVDFYREAALREGCVLIAGDGPQPPRLDSAAWRAAMTLAVIDALHRSFPGSDKWPMICAGFSGGAKRAAFIAPLLAKSGCRITGIFLTGIGEDRLSDGYRQFAPGSHFLQTPVFISSGRDDFVAPLNQQLEVKLAVVKTGFTRVRHESFRGKHSIKLSHFVEALRWFRSGSSIGPPRK